MQTSVVTMTPEMAEKLLAQNCTNRKIVENVVAKYECAIKNNRWKLTHQAIAVGTNGALLDGQHRLLAIVRTGVPVEILMAEQCEPETFSVIDTGRSRRASDILSISGAPSPTITAAGISSYLFYQKGIDVWHSGKRPDNSEIQACYDKNRDRADYAATLATAVYGHYRPANKTAIFAFVLLALDVLTPESLIQDFCHKLKTGAGLDEGSPVLRYRAALANGLIRGYARGNNNHSQIHLACLIKTYNYEQEGVSLKLFKMPSLQPMPKIWSSFD